MRSHATCILAALLVGAIASFTTGHAEAACPGDPTENVAIGRGGSTDQQPVTISNGLGGAIVVWEGSGILAQKLDPASNTLWTQNGVLVSSTTSDQADPTVVSDGAGGAIVAWVDSRAGLEGIYAQRIDATGNALWGDGVPVSLNGPYPLGAVHPRITTDGMGGAVLAWQVSVFNPSIRIQRLDANGVLLWGANGVYVYPGEGLSIVSDGASGAIVTWQLASGSENYNILAQRVNASGTPMWMNPTVGGGPGEQEASRIVEDGSGGAIIAWTDYRSGNADIYVQRVDGTGIHVWTPNGVGLCTAAGVQAFPGIVSDGAGGAIVAWVDRQSDPDEYVRARRIDGAGTPMWVDNGVSLSAPTNEIHATGVPMAMIPDDAGGAIVCWSSFNAACDVLAQRVDGVGAILWGSSGVVVSTATSCQLDEAIGSDGDGGAFVAWTDIRNFPNTGPDIYGQRVHSSGTLAGFSMLTATSGAGGSVTPSGSIRVACGADQTFNIEPDVGYEIEDVLVNGASVGTPTTYEFEDVNANQSISASFKEVSTRTLVDYFEAKASAREVTIRYRLASTIHGVIEVERAERESGPWSAIAARSPTGADAVELVDRDVKEDASYWYRIVSSSTGATLGLVGPVRLESLSNAIALTRIWPNPVERAGRVEIAFSLPRTLHVQASITDVQGREVAKIADDVFSAGHHVVEWTRKPDPTPLQPAIYFVRLRSLGGSVFKTVVVLR